MSYLMKRKKKKMINTDIIKKHEGLRLNAYLCPAGVWTIGYGNTMYEDGTRVKKGDKITKERAEQLFTHIVGTFAMQVLELIKVPLSDNQQSALVSFAYNVGVPAFRKSTLLKRVNENPNNPLIESEFNKWVKGGGVILPGLVKRRKEESKLYFS